MTLPGNLRSLGNARVQRYRRRLAAPGSAVPAGLRDHRTSAGLENSLPAANRTGPGGGVAFVFAGGGSLCAPQVGMLRALSEAGLVPDLVVGASAGAVNAVAFASDPGPAGTERLASVWLSLRRRQVAPLSPRTLLAAAAGRGDGLVPGSALQGLLAGVAVAAMLAGTSIPAHVVATDLASGAAVILSDGETVPALLASCAFPGLYAPVQVGERLLIDGGVSADVPVLQAENLGATVTYVLPAAGFDPGQSLPRGPMPLAFRALGQILGAVARGDVAAARGPVHVLPAPGSRAVSPVDFRDTPRLIEEGYRLAAGWLASQQSRLGTAAQPPGSSPGQPAGQFAAAR